LSADKLSADKLSADKLSADEFSADELSAGKLPLYHCFTVTRNCARILSRMYIAGGKFHVLGSRCASVKQDCQIFTWHNIPKPESL
jgi:hypothetical protein